MAFEQTKTKMIEFYKNNKKLSIFLIVCSLLILFMPSLLIIPSLWVKSFILAMVLLVLLKNFVLNDLYNKYKIPFIALSIFLVLFMSYVLALVMAWVPVSMVSAPTERNYVGYMTGVVEPMSQMMMTPEDISRLKQDNVNNLAVYPSTYLPPYLSFFYELEKPLLIGLVKEAKKQGLSVRVSGQGGPGVMPESISDEWLDTISARVLEWAEISEQLGVEYFTPWAEVDAIGTEKAINWHSEILPQIRQRFSGKVLSAWACCSSDDVYKEDDPNTPWDETGEGMRLVDAYIWRINASKDFDGVMIDYPAPTEQIINNWFNKSDQAEWVNTLDEIVIATADAAENTGIPIYVGEFRALIESPLESIYSRDVLVYNMTGVARYYDSFLGTVMPHYDGVTHCGLFFGFFQNDTREAVIKDYFGEYT